MTIRQYLLLCTYVQMTANWKRKSYKDTDVIPRVFCKDGYNLSVQCHRAAHCKFNNTPINEYSLFPYAEKVGEDIIMAETDSEDLNQYGIDTIEDIQELIDKHGGIDIDKTLSNCYKTHEQIWNS